MGGSYSGTSTRGSEHQSIISSPCLLPLQIIFSLFVPFWNLWLSKLLLFVGIVSNRNIICKPNSKRERRQSFHKHCSFLCIAKINVLPKILLFLLRTVGILPFVTVTTAHSWLHHCRKTISWWIIRIIILIRRCVSEIPESGDISVSMEQYQICVGRLNQHHIPKSFKS